MKANGESSSPRRLGGIVAAALAAGGLYASTQTSATTEGWPFSLILGLVLLLVYALLSPRVVNFALILDARRALRQWLEEDEEPAVPGLRTRAAEVTSPLLMGLILFVVVQLALDLAVAVEPDGELATGQWVTVMLLLTLLALPAALLLPARWINHGAEWLERVSLTLAASVAGALGPVTVPLAQFINRLTDAADGELPTPSRPDADLADAIEVSSHHGELSLVQSELLRRELDFATKSAADIMVPRVQVEYLDLDQTVAEAHELVIGSQFSRYPVKQDSVDNIVAVLHVKSLLRHLQTPDLTLRKVILLERPPTPLHLAADLPLEQVLESLKRTKTSLAVIDDSYGGVAGILTVEDVAEELVGEIVDEWDRELVSDTFVCSGRRLVAELTEVGLELSAQREQTIAEFLTDRLATDPREGQVWTDGTLRLVVEATDADGAIELVRVEREWHEPAEEGEG